MSPAKESFIVLSLLFICFYVKGQSPYINSLYQAYLSESEETKYYTLYRYCFRLAQYDMEKTTSMLEKGEAEIQDSDLSASEIDYHLGLYSYVKASIAENKGALDESLTHYQHVLKYSQKLTGKKNINFRRMQIGEWLPIMVNRDFMTNQPNNFWMLKMLTCRRKTEAEGQIV